MSEKGGNRDAMHLKRLTWSQGHGSDSSVSRLRFVHPESSIKSHIYTYIMLWFFAFAWEKNLLEDITMQDYAAGVTERTKDVTMMSGSKGSRDHEVKKWQSLSLVALHLFLHFIFDIVNCPSLKKKQIWKTYWCTLSMK